jgi:SWIM zinc finger
MDARQQRGLVIAATQPITPCGNTWLVPSQSNGGKYTVRVDKPEPFCSCPDHEAGFKCKHIFAVEFTVTRITQERSIDGTITTTAETITVKTTAERKTYKQDWPAYHESQVKEREHFHELLADLCAPIPTPAPKGKKGGRPALPLCDSIFSACLKVYSTMSARRFSGDLQEAHDHGFIRTLPHFNSVLNVFDNADVTPILKELVRVSALPLAKVETKIAVDSSGSVRRSSSAGSMKSTAHRNRKRFGSRRTARSDAKRTS